MKIGLLGAGRMGQMLGRLFLQAGHKVVLANSRGPASLSGVVADLGEGASAESPEVLGALSDVIIIAVPWQHIPAALATLGDLTGKIVVDTTNNRVGPRPEDVVDLGGRGSSEVVAELVPGALLVKAFNHQPIPSLAQVGSAASAQPRALFIAGDDHHAKKVVAQLIRDIGGVPIDTGTLRAGGRLLSTGTGPLAGHGRLLTVDEAEALLRQVDTDRATREHLTS